MIFKYLKWVFIKAYIRLVIPKKSKMPTGDRLFLESKLFKEIILNYDNLKILFVGVHKYSYWYASIFNNFTSNIFYTIDLEYGASNKKTDNNFHIVGDFLKYDFGRKFDIIFFNGVFGYGINELDFQKEAILKIHKLMNNNNSYFIFGYRANKDLKEEVSELIINKFKKVKFSSIESDLIVNKNNNHKFSFWSLY